MGRINYEEFETLLLKMKHDLESNIERLKNEMDGINSSDQVNDMQDTASLESERMHHTALLDQQQHELVEVDHALSKIKAGTYGICERSGDRIPVARLRVEPHTRYCVEDAREMEG